MPYRLCFSFIPSCHKLMGFWLYIAIRSSIKFQIKIVHELVLQVTLISAKLFFFEPRVIFRGLIFDVVSFSENMFLHLSHYLYDNREPSSGLPLPA